MRERGVGWLKRRNRDGEQKTEGIVVAVRRVHAEKSWPFLHLHERSSVWLCCRRGYVCSPRTLHAHALAQACIVQTREPEMQGDTSVALVDTDGRNVNLCKNVEKEEQSKRDLVEQRVRHPNFVRIQRYERII